MFPRLILIATSVAVLSILPLSLLVARPADNAQSFAQSEVEQDQGYSILLPSQVVHDTVSITPTGGTNPLAVVPVAPPSGPTANPLDAQPKASPQNAVPYHDQVQVQDAALRPNQPSNRQNSQNRQTVRPSQFVTPARPAYVRSSSADCSGGSCGYPTSTASYRYYYPTYYRQTYYPTYYYRPSLLGGLFGGRR